MSDFTIRELLYEDIDNVSRIHIASFSDRALSQLGRGAVKRYYEFLFTNFLQSYPICAEENGNTLVGFCFAGVYSGSFSGFLRKHKWYLAGQIISHPWLFFNPIVREQASLALKTLRSFFMSKFYRRPRHTIVTNKPSPGSPERHKPWGILSIAVDPAFQRRGVAEAMMRFIENMLKEKGIESMHLSVHTDNSPAVRFYEKMGWEKMPFGEEWQGKMMKRLN
jgi:ribosomal protein S18 acetylase RimI-like enzyme